MENKQEKAIAAFMQNVEGAKGLLNELREFFENHMETSSDDINWGHVGSAGYALGKLTELADWAFQRGEYAE